MLITGKGGVGRTCVTAALAHVAQRAHKRVLVAETSDGGSDYSALAQLFGRPQLPVAPASISEGIDGVQLLTRTGVELFLGSVLRIPVLARKAANFEPLQRLLGAAPSFREMGWFFHLLSLLTAQNAARQPRHDLILVDMPATGHALALATLPEILLRLFTRGPVAEGIREGKAFLEDPARTAAYIVTLPETLPITEALELMDGLHRTRVQCSGFFLNRLAPDEFSEAETAALETFLGPRRVLGMDGFARIRSGEAMVDRLRGATSLPHVRVAEVDKQGPELVALLASILEGATWTAGARHA